MPFKPGQSGNPSGRPKGALGVFTRQQKEIEQQLIEAAKEVILPEVAKKLVQTALYCALSENHDFGPLASILKYVARQMPQELKLDSRHILSMEHIDSIVERMKRAKLIEPRKVTGNS